MVKVNLKGPDGNVFVLMGMARSFQKQLINAGVKGGNPYLAKALKDFMEMKCEEIVELLRKSEFFEFYKEEEEE